MTHVCLNADTKTALTYHDRYWVYSALVITDPEIIIDCILGSQFYNCRAVNVKITIFCWLTTKIFQGTRLRSQFFNTMNKLRKLYKPS